MTTTANQPEVRLSDYTSWITDPIKDKAREKAQEYADNVAPGADREQITTMAKPWVAMACVAMAGAAAHAALESTGAEAETVLATAVAAFAVAVVLGMQAKRRLLCVKRRTRVYAFLAAAAGWITAASMTGVTGPMLYTLAAFGIASSLWYWADKGLGYGWSVTPVAVPEEAQEEDVYGERWDKNLGSTGLLRGTKLTSWERLEFGHRYVLEAIAGKHTTGVIQGMTQRIKSGLQLRQQHLLLIEEHPELDAPTMLVTIIDRSPVAGGVSLMESDGMTSKGAIPLGVYADGQGTSFWQLYVKNRIRNGFIAGVAGSGKSRITEVIGLTAAASGEFPTAIWYVDGQEGSSSPLLMKHADWFAGQPEGIIELLEAALAVAGIQGRENRMRGLQGFTPTDERPGLLVIVDEARLILGSNDKTYAERAQYLIREIAANGNKAGVAIIVAAQEATLDAFGGAIGKYSTSIRGNLLGGNGVLMRTKQGVANNIFDVDPALIKQLPKSEAGYGLIGGQAGERAAMFRGYNEDDETMEEFFSEIEWRSVSGLVALDLGPAYTERKVRLQQAQEDDAKWAAERERRSSTGESEYQEPVRPHLHLVKNDEPWSIDSHGSFIAGVHKLQDAFGAPSLNPSQQKVLQAVRDGAKATAELKQATGMSKSTLHRHLKTLSKMDLVAQEQHGSWRAA